MKSKIIKALPTVFSLRSNSDYSKHVVQSSASEMMRDTWIGVGHRLNQAIYKVGQDVEKQQKKCK
ncbi:MAG: hypothetical protein JWR56_765 [Massilia sp.]|nr:hypothetical protein [Massilia sp.]